MKTRNRYLWSRLVLHQVAACTLLLPFLASGPSSRLLARAPQPGPSSNEAIQREIVRIFRDTIRGGQSVADGGVPTWTRVPPSSNDLKRMRALGDEALPTLVGFLSSGNGPEKLLAVEFLGALGGGRVVQPLSRVVLDKKNDLSLRLAALLSLRNGSFLEVVEVLRQVVETETDSNIRDQARDMLGRACLCAPNEKRR